MKFLAAIRNTLTVAAIVLLNPLFIAGHASATSTMTHEVSGGSHHSTGQSPACISRCSTVTLKSEEKTKLSFKEQDDESFSAKSLPFYVLNDRNCIPEKLASSYIQKQLVFRPPDLVKLYSNYRF
jgi:hypothetical protein